MRNSKILFLLAIVLRVQAQSLLEDFTSQRLNGQGVPLFAGYNGEDPGQVCTIANGALTCIGSTTATNPTNGTGFGIYWNELPQGTTGYNYTPPCSPSPASPNCGYTSHWIKAGTFDPNSNRLSFEVTCTSMIPKSTQGGSSIQLGNYVRDRASTDPTNQGQHFYNFLNSNFYPGIKVIQTINNHPQHRVTMSGSLNWPNDPQFTAGVLPQHFMESLTRWYWDTQGKQWSGVSCSFRNITLNTVNGEPDEYVSGTSVTYNGSMYELGFMGVKNDWSKFNLYYNAGVSMHTVGISQGTLAGTFNYDSVGFGGPNDYPPVSGVVNAALQPVMYVAVRPVIAITAVSYGAAVAIVTKASPMFAAGEPVAIANVPGIANGNYFAAVPVRTLTAAGDETSASTAIYLDAGLSVPVSAAGTYAGHLGTIVSASDKSGFTEVLYTVGNVSPIVVNINATVTYP